MGAPDLTQVLWLSPPFDLETDTAPDVPDVDTGDGRDELYSILADRYASAQEGIESANSEILQAIDEIVIRNSCLQTKEDCLGAVVQTYESLSSITDKFVPPARALSVFVLRISRLATINDYLRDKKIKVRPAWALISSLAGYPIDSEFIGLYPDGISSSMGS